MSQSPTKQFWNTLILYTNMIYITWNKRRHFGYTDRWNSSLFIDSKLSAAQAPGDERALGSACCSCCCCCCCAFSLQYICDAGTKTGFLYASFTLQTPQFSSFPGLSKRLYESRLLGFSDIWLNPPAQVPMNDDCASVSVHCCKAQSEACSIPRGLGFTTTGWIFPFLN